VPRFVFRFEGVLAQRRAREREAQLAVAALERERLRLEEVIRMHQREIDRTREELRAFAGEGTVDVDAARRALAAAGGFAGRAQRAVLELHDVHRRLEIAREALRSAMVARKAVETLRERRLQAFLEDQKRREHAGMDELVVMRAGRAEVDA
jgi:flagellar export protein FliJ